MPIAFVPYITYAILVITILFSVINMQNTSVKMRFMFNPYSIHHRREWWRFFTHGLLHADGFHLIFNMLALYSFGEFVEFKYIDEFHEVKGYICYALLYVGALFASSTYSYERHKNNIHYNALGASGAVSAVIYAAILFNPTGQISFFFFPMPSWLFGIAYLVISYVLARRGNTLIGHDAHFWGAVYGLVFTLVLKPELGRLFFEKITGYFGH